MERAVFTVGIGNSPRFREGTTLEHLEAELKRVREQYSAPDDAKVVPTAPGSIYLAEVIWIGEVSR